MTSELRLDGKVAIVTGAALGIGREIAELLARRGASVVVNGNYRESGHGPEEDVAAAIRANGGQAVGSNGSVADDAACRAAVNCAIQNWGRLDILVNNAGTTDTKLRIEDAPNQIIDDQFAVHVKGPQHMFRAAWPDLVQSGAGRVVNVGSASSLGIKSRHGWGGSYAIVKSALYGLTRQMAGVGADHGVKANLILPNAYSTMLEKSFGGTPFGNWMKTKMPAPPVASAAFYLMHPDCPVSGQFFTIGGGRMARVVFASNNGLFDPALTPEHVRDRWLDVMGVAEGTDQLNADFFELTGQGRDNQAFREVLGD